MDGDDQIINLFPGTVHIGLGGNSRPIWVRVVNADDLQAGFVSGKLNLAKLLGADDKAVGALLVLVGSPPDLADQASSLKVAQ